MKRFEVLPGLPGDGPLPVYFGFEEHGHVREGLVVRFLPAAGDPWVGNFQVGDTALNQVIEGSSPEVLTVIAGGQAYEVDIDAQRALRKFGGAIEFVAPVAEIDAVLFGNGLWLEASNPPAVVWRTRRLSWDGMRRLSISGPVLTGEAYNPFEDRWESFSVDLKNGTATGGSYNGPE